jgi:hypothetical protein
MLRTRVLKFEILITQIRNKFPNSNYPMIQTVLNFEFITFEFV